MNRCQSFMEQNVFERKKKQHKENKGCLQDEACLGTTIESAKANYDTSVHVFGRSRKSFDDLPAATPSPYPSPRHCAVLFSLSDWSAVTYRFLITVLVHQKIKIPA